MQTNESVRWDEVDSARSTPPKPEASVKTFDWHPNGAIFLLPTGLVLAGPQSRFFADIRANGAVLVKRLHPRHWADWLEVNARSHADRMAALPEAIAIPASEVVRFARRVAGENECVSLIGNWLEESLGRAAPGHGALLTELVEAALDDPDVRNAQMLCRRAGMSHRQLASLCDRNFGFTPNLLLRRARFLRSFAAIAHLPWGHWTGAIDPAYFDQSHFIRDCHRFLGMTPSRFLAERTQESAGTAASNAA